MKTIQNNLDNCKADTSEAVEIVLYGPTWVNVHPYSEALESDLKNFNWTTWRDGFGRLCAMAKFIRPDPQLVQ